MGTSPPYPPTPSPGPGRGVRHMTCYYLLAASRRVAARGHCPGRGAAVRSAGGAPRRDGDAVNPGVDAGVHPLFVRRGRQPEVPAAVRLAGVEPDRAGRRNGLADRRPLRRRPAARLPGSDDAPLRGRRPGRSKAPRIRCNKISSSTRSSLRWPRGPSRLRHAGDTPRPGRATPPAAKRRHATPLPGSAPPIFAHAGLTPTCPATACPGAMGPKR